MKPPLARFLPALFLALAGAPLRAEPTGAVRQIDFGSAGTTEGWRPVGASMLYSNDAGVGWEPGASLTVQDRGGDPVQGDFVTSSAPFLFSVAVPEGSYRVTVWLGDLAGTSDTTVKAESRQLMLESVRTAHGEIAEGVFIVNVRNRFLAPPPKNAPGGAEVRLNPREQTFLRWDEKLTLEFNGPAPKVCAVRIEPVAVPTLFLLGDSTVTDQPFEPGASWGQMLPRFFKPEIAIANHAESGETLKSFLTELRLDKVLSQAKPGDFAAIQFGHNDQKAQWPHTYVEAGTTYRSYLKTYLAEFRRRGVTPILITSVQRRSFDHTGSIKNTHGDYPDAVRAVAKEEGVALIDLHEMSTRLYEALGPDKAPRAFSAGGTDATHHNNYGAYELARCVVEGLRRAGSPLSQYLSAEAGAYDPARPDSVDTFNLPASPQRSDERPRGN